MSSRKEMQTIRMYNFFIDATASIIENEGIEKVTARKIGDIAGYTSSTIYNYFDELSHLIFFASMRFLNEYNEDLSGVMLAAKNAVDRYINTWECFCKHSFENPQIFHAIFISDLGTDPNLLIDRYYDLYHNDLVKLPEEIKIIVLEHDLYKRNYKIVQGLAEEGYISEENIDYLLRTTILMWKGMLITLFNNRSKFTPDEAVKEFTYLISQLIKVY
ncbi:TetR/AcrR family transcriptional regulator [Bacillus sp. S3]|uniref:TetR/AcrR family transcriptional regulator n=1 Tax=Bacillus sp. S3 TaxID=486398 RepID=UPI00118A6FA2|nr:TetR/AcrR family transcriptional regulator [Bacillus sp. S3]QCJ44352.1 TetR/AcrR family transcriptional regulator [Bacillus sp. S3]